MTARISADDATAKDLRDFATTHHGIEVPTTANRAHIIALLETAGVELSGGVPVSNAPAGASGDFGVTMKMPKEIAEQDRVTIMISKEKGGIDPVPVAVNGYAVSIRRGQKVSIPMGHYRALMDSIELDYPTDQDGNIVNEPNEVPRFPVQVFGVPG